MSNPSCVLLAGRHPALAEGIRGLLETVFAVVVMVADWRSLVAAAGRLDASLVIVDLAVAEGRMAELVAELRVACPGVRVVALSVEEHPAIQASMLSAGVDRCICLCDVAYELIPAAEALVPAAAQGVDE